MRGEEFLHLIPESTDLVVMLFLKSSERGPEVLSLCGLSVELRVELCDLLKKPLVLLSGDVTRSLMLVVESGWAAEMI